MLINCDMGESYGIWEIGQDKKIMPFIDMANIACGMHASDPGVMLKTVRYAKEHGVQIGAHPGYPDLQGFGRRFIEMPTEELKAYVIYQLGALSGICQSEDVAISYVKPHGALYNAMMKSDDIYISLLEAIASYDINLPLMIMAVPDHLHYTTLAEQYGVKLIFEAFVDRSYLANGRLTPRSQPGALHDDLEVICTQAMKLISDYSITSIEGTEVKIKADTLCIHGDGKLAADIAKNLRMRIIEYTESRICK
ncbi:5-oxoprolinase subunit PxpA [Psychromonas sp. KJ10-10]|uniref:5-oxoprolinase subunit PxpA n=1 Tax=Psychromonas sp. KJ10-10 TaxID=3391823 RepID=UPI0039B5DC04